MDRVCVLRGFVLQRRRSDACTGNISAKVTEGGRAGPGDASLGSKLPGRWRQKDHKFKIVWAIWGEPTQRK